MTEITAIRMQDVVNVWTDAEPALRRATERMGERTTHDVLVQLVTGNAQLWRVGDGWCVTEIANYPRKRVALVTLFGGAFDPGCVRDARAVLLKWAQHYQAGEIRIIGRRGWLKYFPEFHETTVMTLCLPCQPPPPPIPPSSAA